MKASEAIEKAIRFDANEVINLIIRTGVDRGYNMDEIVRVQFNYPKLARALKVAMEALDQCDACVCGFDPKEAIAEINAVFEVEE